MTFPFSSKQRDVVFVALESRSLNLSLFDTPCEPALLLSSRTHSFSFLSVALGYGISSQLIITASTSYQRNTVNGPFLCYIQQEIFELQIELHLNPFMHTGTHTNLRMYSG